MSIPAAQQLLHTAPVERFSARDAAERRRAGGYPISRWYLRPAAGVLAAALAPTKVRPWHLTLAGLLAAIAAAGTLIWHSSATLLAPGLVLAAWFFDRCDGMLARRQGTATPLGAWLDANVDELVDVGLHVAVAFAAASAGGSSLPWFLLIGFLAGKYLLVYGLAEERHLVASLPATGNGDVGGLAPLPSDSTPTRSVSEANRSPTSLTLRVDMTGENPRLWTWLKRLYHLPSNADVRVHLLASATFFGWLTAELALVAVYYNARWIARYVLVGRRLRGGAA